MSKKPQTIKEQIDRLKTLQKKYNDKIDRQVKLLQEKCDHNEVYDPLHKFHKCVCCQKLRFDNESMNLMEYWKNS